MQSNKQTHAEEVSAPHKNQGQEVAHRLKMAILKGQLQPDEWIREETLSRRFAVSRTPVREALVILENEGFIRSIPYRGKQVNEMSSQIISEYYLIMSALEELAVRTAGPLMTGEDFIALEQLLDTFDQLTKTGQVQHLKACHRRFHNFFIEKAGIARLKQLLLEQYSLFTKRTDTPAQVDDEPVNEYRSILDALLAQDFELAGKRMRAHILRGREAQIKRFEREVKQKPESFTPIRDKEMTPIEKKLKT